MDPDVKYNGIYTGDFNDPSKARAAAATLYSGDIDVLFAGLDAAVQGLYAAAEGREGKWVIPQYIDSYEKAPKVYGLPEIAEKMIKDQMAGKLKQRYEFNSEVDGDKWSLGPFRDHEDVIGAENIAKLEELEKNIKSGKLRVPNQFEIGKKEDSEKFEPTELGPGCAS